MALPVHTQLSPSGPALLTGPTLGRMTCAKQRKPPPPPKRPRAGYLPQLEVRTWRLCKPPIPVRTASHAAPTPPAPSPTRWPQGLGADCRRALTLDVQITSRKLMFIQLSQLTRCPLYVSPFLSSTNWRETVPESAKGPKGGAALALRAR